MQKRQLGKDGPMVGAIGHGAMSFCDFFGKTDEATSHRTLDRARELGVTHIDTALIYGPFDSENIIGSYLAKNPAAKKEFSIATKGGINPNPRKVDNSPAFLRECLESSLKRLGVDQVDLYYVHRRDHAIPIEDVTGTLARFVEEGKIKGIGFSEISPASLQRAASVHPVAAVQNEYSLWTRLPELGMLQACQRLGTAFVAFSPVARGMLTDKGIDPPNLPASDFRKLIPRYMEPNLSFNLKTAQNFRTYAHDRGWTAEALAIAWTLHQGSHIIPIPGTRTVNHLEANVAAAGIKLTPKDLAEIETIIPIGSAHGNRYSTDQQGAAEHYC